MEGKGECEEKGGGKGGVARKRVNERVRSARKMRNGQGCKEKGGGEGGCKENGE